MDTEYCNVPLEIEDADNVELPRAKTVLAAIQRSPYCTIVKLGRVTQDKDIFKQNDEVVIFDTEAEVPQYPKNDVRKNERIAVIFPHEDNATPWVFALRKDFPEVVHQNSFFSGYPRSLCIYEKLFDELKISWSSAVFIEDIRSWLKLTAKGKLHQDDQQLEPFVLFNSGDIILPHDIKPNEKLYAFVTEQKSKRVSVLTSRSPFNATSKINLKVIPLSGETQTHGIIKFTPRNCEDLNSFLQGAKIDFKEELIKALRNNRSNSNERLVFLITLPKKRTETSLETVTEIHAYILFESIQQIGIKLGLWGFFDNKLVEIVGFDITKANFKEINAGLIKPHFSFNKELASLLNNSLQTPTIVNILAVGLGSLGSQVFMNLARSGWGKWNLVDDDILLPHNLARHSLFSNFVLSSKVEALSLLANDMLSDETFSFPLYTNLLRQASEEETKLLDEKIKGSDIVFDFSATISVPRYLCNNPKFLKKRVLSSFLNPAGDCCVILLEDKSKKISVDVIEMLFYRELLNNVVLKDYFAYNEAGSIRYSTSCKDVSSQIPQDHLAIHAASLSNFIKKNISKTEAYASVLKYNSESLTLDKQEIKIPTVLRYKISDWEIIIDNILVEKIYSLRKAKLPKETGGILIGAWDVEYKRIYILDTIIPADNSEYPTFFYRGIGGLKEELQKANKATAGTLKYVGEWHSHPDNCTTNPSGDDLTLLSWLTENMSLENLPAIMLIMGEKKKYSFCFGKTIE